MSSKIGPPIITQPTTSEVMSPGAAKEGTPARAEGVSPSEAAATFGGEAGTVVLTDAELVAHLDRAGAKHPAVTKLRELAAAQGTMPPGASVADAGDVDVDLPAVTKMPLWEGTQVEAITRALKNLEGPSGDVVLRYLDAKFVALDVFKNLEGLETGSGGMRGLSMLSTTIADAGVPSADAMRSAADRGFEGVDAGALPTDIHALVQWVLRESYMEQTRQLADHAKKVKFFNEKKKEIRERLDVMRGQASLVAGEEDSFRLPNPLNPEPILTDPALAYANQEARTDAQTAAALAQEAKNPPPDGVINAATGAMTSQDIEAALAAGEKVGIPFKGEYVVLEGAPPGTTATFKGSTGKVEFGDKGGQYRMQISGIKLLPETVAIVVDEAANIETIDMRAFETTKAPTAPFTVNKNYGGGKGNIGDYAEDYKASVLDQIGRLSPAEREALFEKIKKDGLTVSSSALESDGGWSGADTRETASVNAKPGPGETLESFLERIIDNVAGEISANIHGNEGSATMRDNKYSIAFPGFEVDAPAHPEIAAKAGLETGVSGLGSGPAKEFKEGQPIETKAQLESYIESLEEKLATVGEDAQLANVDLQNVLQKQQQTMQQMSNISKMVHDTMMAVIRKIGG